MKQMYSAVTQIMYTLWHRWSRIVKARVHISWGTKLPWWLHFVWWCLEFV